MSRIHANLNWAPIEFFVIEFHLAGSNENRLWPAFGAFHFDMRHEVQLREFVGFFFGEIHGKVLSSDGNYRSDITTLITLTGRNEQRGYQAGRLWFFYEATPCERVLVEDELLKRLREYVVDSVMWNDPQEVWYYTIACLLGELSGNLFPLTVQEQQEWDAECRFCYENLDQQ